ncbi:MAG: hypothetical protein A2Z47_11970 [Thermodesulfovibrio sp. RBG_19FT_COMBO_42_12]|nr:MAG: hypothetical protein A2Z47_11970 [Thermodesulfovibrio sp. RBG_19FT_COMBO_42_12]
MAMQPAYDAVIRHEPLSITLITANTQSRYHGKEKKPLKHFTGLMGFAHTSPVHLWDFIPKLIFCQVLKFEGPLGQSFTLWRSY